MPRSEAGRIYGGKGGTKGQIETIGELKVLLLRKRWEREEKQEELKLGCALQVKV